MKSQKTLDRLAELDALLRDSGADITVLAAKWGVQPERVMGYLSYLRFEHGRIESQLLEVSGSEQRLYYYAFVPKERRGGERSPPK